MISYCMIFAFQPKLKIEGIVVYRNFQQNSDIICNVYHLNEKMLNYLDVVTLNQLKDAHINLKKKYFILLFLNCFPLN